MAYACGIKWTEDKVFRLKELVLAGLTTPEISNILAREFGTDVTVQSVEKARYNYKVKDYYIELDKKIKIYSCITLPLANYMVSCDYHSPFFSELYLNRLLAIANKFKIKKHIIIGDYLDFLTMRRHYTEKEAEMDIDKEILHTEPTMKALDFFDENILLQGNHERRVGIKTEGRLQAKHLFGLLGADIWAKKFKYSIYDKMYIGKEWMLVHPQSYSQISPQTARRLAEKFHRHIINAHGHLVGTGYDRSGKFMTIDLGGMFDTKKIDYINLRTTTHPVWKNGFGMIKDGKFYHFTDESDWSFWLK